MAKHESEVKEKLTRKKEPPRHGLSTGSTLLNLACSDSPMVGFYGGRYYFLVGDSSSGKTFLSLTCFAEAKASKHFKNHRLIFDDVEGGALMNLEKYFGKAVADSIEPPRWEDGLPMASESIEEFYFNVDDAIKEGKPFIYVLDSMDALTSEDERSKFDETKTALRAGKTAAGAYGDGKAKKNAANLRRVISELRKTDSILIILNQTRDNLGFGFEKKTRSGGHALRFYATLEIWSSVKEKITGTVRGRKVQTGITCALKVKKNRQTGKERTIESPIFYDYGIDDVSACISYLIDVGHWQKKGPSIQAPEFDFKGTEKALLSRIEDAGEVQKLRLLVGSVWRAFEADVTPERKRRYE